MHYLQLEDWLDTLRDQFVFIADKQLPYNSLHEGYGFLMKEVQEFFDAVKNNSPIALAENEVYDIGVVVLRLLQLITILRGGQAND